MRSSDSLPVSSSFGHIFRVHTFGESHAEGLGVVIDGCPAGIELDLSRISKNLQRRKPGQSHISTQRKEKDEFKIISGTFENKTLGSPLCFIVYNENARGKDYEKWASIYRPSHADYTYDAKYHYRSPLGGSRASARETIGRVIAGSIAAQILQEELGIYLLSWVDSIGEISPKKELHKRNCTLVPSSSPAEEISSLYKEMYEKIEGTIVRTLDSTNAPLMIKKIEQVRKQGDSIGGILSFLALGVPAGLGEPVFDKLDAALAQAFLSIPACKGFENGLGFAAQSLLGSEHNDTFLPSSSQESDSEKPPILKTLSNHSGGLQGGISNGMPIFGRLIFKPTATIQKEQKTVDENGMIQTLLPGGRHDPCVLARAVPIVDAMLALVLCDAYLLQRARNPKWWQRHSISQ